MLTSVKTLSKSFCSVCGLSIILMMAAAAGKLHAQEYSVLWGKAGEKWNKEMLPNFTSAGYKSGKQKIPTYKKTVNVKKFGAQGDGVTDDTEAVKKAIDACKAFTTLYFPEGKYILSTDLKISINNFSITGAGQDKTTLFFKYGLDQIYPKYNLDFKNQTIWSWSGAMVLFDGTKNSGIQDLKVSFPDSLYGGHNWHERGYNGIGFSRNAQDGWIKNVTFTNCDLGIWIEHSAHHISATNWRLTFDAKRAGQKISGHHGINVYGCYNLIENFEIIGRYVHDLSIESKDSHHNVFRAGSGTDLCIDHHNHDQKNNLFTNLDAGLGTRLYHSGGKKTPRGICFNETFWNITAQKDMMFCDQHNDEKMQSKNNISVGVKTALPSNLSNKENNHFEAIDPLRLLPKDLYLAQKELLKP